jgi:hypothetical protein
MPKGSCATVEPHGPHEWYWKNILRRECPGREAARAPHPFGDVCEHGVGFLDECKQCPGGWQARSDAGATSNEEPA